MINKMYNCSMKHTASLLVPSRLYPYYLLTKLYDKIGDSKKAMSTAAIVLTKDAKIHSEAIIEMRKEVQEIYNKHRAAILK